MIGWLRRQLSGKTNRYLIEQVDGHAKVLARMSAELAEMRREMRLGLRCASLPPSELWLGRPAATPGAGPGVNVFPRGALCRQDNFHTPYFSYWTRTLGLDLRYHRKIWEYVFILQALHERGALVAGAKGLGFGVGEEPLPAYLASLGCRILGTDMGAEQAHAAGWTLSGEHATGKDTLRRPGLCPDAVFDANVSFRISDMKAIPADLRGFDFCWSACALEHLGSIEQGLNFILESVECLAPGGWAVHTTEFNLESNDETVDDNIRTVLFRRRDFEELTQRVQARGWDIAPFDFDPGSGELDRYIDLPPYVAEPHLKLSLEGYATTSIGLIIRRTA